MVAKSPPISLFMNKISISVPFITQRQFNGSLPMFGSFSIPLTRILLSSFCYLGVASALFSIYYWGTRASVSLYVKFKSLFNAKKYLDSESLISQIEFGVSNQASEPAGGRAYAVIYGASTLAGSAFAHFLAEKGFNLILIERDLQPLNDLENSLKELMNTLSAAGKSQ